MCETIDDMDKKLNLKRKENKRLSDKIWLSND